MANPFRINPISILLLLFAGSSSFLRAQVPVIENGKPPKNIEAGGYLPSSPNRVTIDLTGRWTVSSDGEEWQDVLVPSAIDEHGTFMFRRTFDVSSELLSSYSFKFVALGVNHDVEVFINDIYIGRHIGGYTPFQFDIPENVLQSGKENAVQLVVVNELSARSTIPVRQQSWGWRTYGGILRDISLIGVPQIWVEDLAPVAAFDESQRAGTVTVETIIAGAPPAVDTTAPLAEQPASYLFILSLIDQQTGAVVTQSPPQIFVPEANKVEEFRSTLQIPQARVWRPDRPDVYELQASVIEQEGKTQHVIDQFSRTIGFQNVVFRDGNLYEDGVRMRLRGVTWHEDAAGGGSLTYDEMERDLAFVKSLGANAVRFAHHPPHPYMLDLCTRYGLYAFVETPVWNVPSAVLGEESFRSLGEQTTREVVSQLRHHPSVLAWGIAGSIDARDPRAASFVSTVSAAVRSLDGRYVYAGIGPGDEDLLAPSLSLAGVFLQGSDVKTFRERLQRLRARYAGRPVVVLSYGVKVDHDNRNGYRDPLSQEAQARFFLQHIAALKESGISGGFVSALADWKGDRPVLTISGDEHTTHPVGLLSRDREKRLAFDVVRSQYQEEKFPAIPAGAYRGKFPAAQVIAGLIIIIVIGYQYSYNRRFGESVRRGFLRSYNFFADIRDRGDVPPFASFVLAICISATIGVVMASVLHHYRSDASMDAIYTMLFTNDTLKVEMIRASWDPLRGIILFSLVALFSSFVLAIFIRLVSLIARSKTPLAKIWVITIWGGLPLVLLSPVGMSLFKVLETPAFVLPSFLVILAVVLWSIVRVMKGTSVVLDVSPARTYILLVLIFTIAAGGLFLYMDGQYALRAAIEHLSTVTTAGI